MGPFNYRERFWKYICQQTNSIHNLYLMTISDELRSIWICLIKSVFFSNMIRVALITTRTQHNSSSEQTHVHTNVRTQTYSHTHTKTYISCLSGFYGPWWMNGRVLSSAHKYIWFERFTLCYGIVICTIKTLCVRKLLHLPAWFIDSAVAAQLNTVCTTPILNTRRAECAFRERFAMPRHIRGTFCGFTMNNYERSSHVATRTNPARPPRTQIAWPSGDLRPQQLRKLLTIQMPTANRLLFENRFVGMWRIPQRLTYESVVAVAVADGGLYKQMFSIVTSIELTPRATCRQWHA